MLRQQIKTSMTGQFIEVFYYSFTTALVRLSIRSPEAWCRADVTLVTGITGVHRMTGDIQFRRELDFQYGAGIRLSDEQST